MSVLSNVESVMRSLGVIYGEVNENMHGQVMSRVKIGGVQCPENRLEESIWTMSSQYSMYQQLHIPTR